MDISARLGVLYLVGTPIGNLQDLSERAMSTLRAVDLVAAEDTRRARQLLSHLSLHKPLESFHGDSDERKRDRLQRVLKAGQSIAYISDGGMPGIADPGRELVAAAVAIGAQVVPVPGPSAVTTALSVSGFVGDRFVFGGFPPRKGGERQQFLRDLDRLGLTIVLYEAPHRVVETLQDVAQVLPERQVVAGRELTKTYEELLRGSAEELVEALTSREPRGEFVLVIEGGEAQAAMLCDPDKVEQAVRRMVQAGLGAREVSEIVSDLGLLARRATYQLALAVRKEMEAEQEK